MPWDDQRICSPYGIPFWNSNCSDLIIKLKKIGGLLVVPSGPGLTENRKDDFYKKSLRQADVAVLDSGYFALILRFLRQIKIERISGLQVLEVLLGHHNEDPLLKNDSTLWVVPNAEEEKRIRNYLDLRKFPLENHKFYEAPFYEKDADFEDLPLFKEIEDLNPQWIILCVAGGKQEKLGLRIRDNFRFSQEFQHSILCIGAAIAFLTGGQATIPKWADRMYLGWLFRTLQAPKKYFWRYVQALRLPFILFNWKR